MTESIEPKKEPKKVKEAKKEKKRKREKAEANPDATGEDIAPTLEKDQKRVKKRKRERSETELATTGETVATTSKKVKKSKKPKKNERKDTEISEEATLVVESAGDDQLPAGSSPEGESTVVPVEPAVPSRKKERFIVFIGNLPYNTTTEALNAHFSKIRPSAVRLATNKTTGKCKGYAFLEFDGYDRMKTCLKLYHHTTFHEDGGNGEGNANGKEGRKINVELTAGGGGNKSKHRKSKLKEKNQKLEQERSRTKIAAGTQESQRQKKDNCLVELERGRDDGGDQADVHPSRRSRVPMR